jgi:hypothetical protein
LHDGQERAPTQPQRFQVVSARLVEQAASSVWALVAHTHDLAPIRWLQSHRETKNPWCDAHAELHDRPSDVSQEFINMY